LLWTWYFQVRESVLKGKGREASGDWPSTAWDSLIGVVQWPLKCSEFVCILWGIWKAPL
jgi:hypothetical protein